MDDFIFGATNFSQERTAQRRKRLGGVVHAYRTEPLAPRPGDVVTVWLWVGDEQRVDRACCYYTTDGSDPRATRRGRARASGMPMWASQVEWVELRWSFGRWWHVPAAGAARGHAGALPPGSLLVAGRRERVGR